MSDSRASIPPEELEMERKREAARIIENIRAIALMKILDIPCNKYRLPADHIPPTVDATDLYNTLMNEEKLQALISKLKLKAFW